ncbi:hypothetical protein L7F22_067803 [Adiantum nelumboides]|nr:hypothetical protein [Adiantum nelumboides]
MSVQGGDAEGIGAVGNFLCDFNNVSSSRVVTSTFAARMFSISDLERATNNFNSDHVVGQGGCGQVFSGMLEDGTEVAIKLMIRDGEQSNNEFFAELEMLSRVHHRNVVKLIGACREENRCCLVYELIPNGNVESHLHGLKKLVQPLDWNARMKIALGAARGLAYLHEDANPRVIHRDFKASSILLERDFTPKISDFGLAMTADKEDGHLSTSVMGTYGYPASEYAMSGHLLVKSDVYGFGVVLLELLSGRRPIDLSQPSGKENLINWARPLLSSEEGLEALADSSLERRFPLDVFSKVAAIASMCVQPDLPYRPFMGEVVQALKVCCTLEEVSSLSVSPQASGGGQASDTKSGPLIDIDGDSPASVNFGVNTGHKTVKDTQESFTTRLSDSGYIHQHLFDSSERHSLSGPSSSNGTMYAWSMERDNDYVLASEHRVFWNKERKCPAWSIKRDNAFASNSEHRVFWNTEKSLKTKACGSWP